MQTVRQLCDHAIWLNKGTVVMKGEAEPVCNAYMDMSVIFSFQQLRNR